VDGLIRREDQRTISFGLSARIGFAVLGVRTTHHCVVVILLDALDRTSFCFQCLDSIRTTLLLCLVPLFVEVLVVVADRAVATPPTVGQFAAAVDVAIVDLVDLRRNVREFLAVARGKKSDDNHAALFGGLDEVVDEALFAATSVVSEALSLSQHGSHVDSTHLSVSSVSKVLDVACIKDKVSSHS
jgi:hypothetical protein